MPIRYLPKEPFEGFSGLCNTSNPPAFFDRVLQPSYSVVLCSKWQPKLTIQ